MLSAGGVEFSLSLREHSSLSDAWCSVFRVLGRYLGTKYEVNEVKPCNLRTDYPPRCPARQGRGTRSSLSVRELQTVYKLSWFGRKPSSPGLE